MHISSTLIHYETISATEMPGFERAFLREIDVSTSDIDILWSDVGHLRYLVSEGLSSDRMMQISAALIYCEMISATEIPVC